MAREEDAYEVYHWKVISHRHRRLSEGRERLAGAVGEDVANHLVRGVARRVRAPRRILVLSCTLLWLSPGPLAAVRGSLTMLLCPVVVVLGNSLLTRGLRKAASLLERDDADPLSIFPERDVARAVRRCRYAVPARALAGQRRNSIASYLGEDDRDVVEIAGKLAEEFSGGALELLDTARLLR